ncbi:glycosyltransferase [Mucilaginibacter terrigena]|uniref:Glycosyltransferase n=1 Tax=Mucilaginibacter terrigena TaxID=2492395 RepID=A0A4Q5LQI5_9SPHI|nr:glycosyltransferase family 4 protein [Mucilaginibacter terrigena]RYU91609.1 glycosyltransferase [Mucilaginibacter terrigena]
MRLAIITTHPIQYYAPIFKLLSQRGKVGIKVFYTLGQQGNKYDFGFEKNINWDIPLLNGYAYEWIENTSTLPGSHHTKGIINPTLINKIKLYNPNALLVFGWNYHSHLKVLRYFKNKIPIYFRGDSTLLNYSNPVKETLKYLYLKWVYKHISHAFYVGTRNKAYFKKYGLKNDQLSFAPHAIDNDRFKVDRSEGANELRASLNLSAGDILIVYAGKFEPVKNLHILIAAIGALNNQKVHLLLVGNGMDELALKQQAGISVASNNIHFLDFVNQTYIPIIYQAANLYCLPSISETWGLSVNEAMACNKAILVSDKVGCAIDLVKPGYNGAIFKSGDENSLLKKLTELTGSADRLTELGKHSGMIIKDWDFTQIAIAIENKLLNETN